MCQLQKTVTSPPFSAIILLSITNIELFLALSFVFLTSLTCLKTKYGDAETEIKKQFQRFLEKNQVI